MSKINTKKIQQMRTINRQKKEDTTGKTFKTEVGCTESNES